MPHSIRPCLRRPEIIKISHTQIQGAVPDEVCDLTAKKLYADDDLFEVFTADCLPDNETSVPFINCSCCDVCCSHTSKQCISQ